MKNKKKTFFTEKVKKGFVGVLSGAMLLCGGLAVGNINLPATESVYAAEIAESTRASEGLTFNSAERYNVDARLNSVPKTFEAYFKLNSDYNVTTGRPGILFSTFGGNADGSLTEWTNPSFGFEINTDGIPRLYYVAPKQGAVVTKGGTLDVSFKADKSKLNADDWVHLAITNDGTTASCYVNGVLTETLTSYSSKTFADYNFDYTCSNNVRVGDDHRPTPVPFKGNIKAMEFYSDVRTADEIAADYARLQTAAPEDENLLCAYDFTQSGRAYLKDLSSNGYDINFAGDDTDGTSFTATELYEVNKSLEKLPQTFEADIYLPKTYTTRPGVIFGNYGKNTDCLSFELSAGGVPRLYYTTASGDKSYLFSSVDVRTGDWAHLAITNDTASGTITCYLDGKSVGTISGLNYKLSHYGPFLIGGDYRSGNEQYFKGLIRSVSLYSDVRTASEVYADYMYGTQTGTDNLLAYYQMPLAASGADIADKSGNGYDVDYQKASWFSDKEEVTGYAYSFAVVGDTQCVNELNPEHMDTLYDWIIDNKDSKKIAHVFGLGDITQSSNADTSAVEWDKAVESISKLNGVLPYSLARGNHDDSVLMNEHFNYDAYTGQFSGFYRADKIESAWRTFTAGETDYLLLVLDYGADDAELAWAGNIIESFPNHKVIITTHAYMYRDGTRLSIDDVCSPADSNDWTVDPYKVYNNGDQMWDKLVSKYGNIFLVLSGHDPCEDVVTLQSKGIHGNTVTQMLIDPQGMDAATATYPESTGMVCMLYFSEDGSQIEVEWYSTIKQQYYKDKNQYTLAIDDQTVSSHTATEYSYNNEEHWKVCSDCSVVYERAAHEYGEWVLTDPTATTAGKRVKTCACGHSVTEVLTAYDFGNSFGASIRIKEPNGIRFVLEISQSVKESIFAAGSNKTLGMFIFPADKIDTVDGDYSKLAQKIDITFTENDLYKVGDFWYANGVMSNMYVQNFNRVFIGVGYIAETVDEQISYLDYTDFTVENNARSLFEVAKASYLDPEEAQYKDKMAQMIEKAIYAAYGIVETRTNNGATVTFSKDQDVWNSYEELKQENPIRIALNTFGGNIGVGEDVALGAKIMIGNTAVDIDVPFEYAVSGNVSLLNGVVTGEKAGNASVTVTLGGYSASVDFAVSAKIGSIYLDGKRDAKYGEFTNLVNLTEDRWHSISAVKTEEGVFVYAQALLNTSIVGDPGTAIHPVWNNSTNFEFRFNMGKQLYVNVAGQSDGVDSFIMSVEEQDGKYLHTFEIFVSKALIACWDDNEDLQINYAWGTVSEKAGVLDDVIDFRYVQQYHKDNWPSSWSNSTNWHAYHRLGGLANSFNDYVANLFVSADGLKTLTTDLENVTIDGIDNDAIEYGENQINVTGGSTTNIKATVVDGDIYMFITITHGDWSAYTTTWHLNDNFEMYIDGEHVVVMFLNGQLSLPAYFTDGASVTTTQGDKLVTTLELYKAGDKDAYKIRMNANGAGFGWNDLLWNGSYPLGYVSASGITRFTAGGAVVDGVVIDGEFNDSVYTEMVKNAVITAEPNGAKFTGFGVKTNKGVLFGFTITTTKDANTVTKENQGWWAYTNPEVRINANGVSYFSTTQNSKESNNALVAYCKSVNNGDGTWTHSYEYFIHYVDLGIGADDQVKFSVGGWYETGWAWLFEGNDTNMTHTLTENGIFEAFEKMSNSEYYSQVSAFGSQTWNTTSRARIAFSVKMLKGTKFTFTGDSTVYDWAVNECADNTQKAVIDKGYLAGNTYVMESNAYPVITLKKDDGSAFTADERMSLHTMFQVDGYKVSPVTCDNEGAITEEEMQAQFVRFGNSYSTLSGTAVQETRASIITSFKVKVGTKVTFIGDTSVYAWAVCEMDNNSGVSANVVSDSRWNNTTDTTKPFLGDASTNEYVMLNDQMYLVITLKRIDGAKFTVSELATLKAMFKVEGEKVVDGTVIPRKDYQTNSVAHRGYSTTAPENTLSAYKLAAQNGFSMVECDVQFTSDGVPVLLHDDTIDRTSNGTGNIAEMTFDEARSYDYGSWKAARYTGEKIPSFEEFIALCVELDLHPYIEIKSTLSEEYAQTLYNIVNAANMLDNVTWISFGSASLGAIASLDTTARLGYVVSNVTADTITTAQSLQTGSNEVFIDSYYNVDATELSLCKNANLALELWTIDSVDTLLAVNEYVSGITSNWLVAGMYLG